MKNDSCDHFNSNDNKLNMDLFACMHASMFWVKIVHSQLWHCIYRELFHALEPINCLSIVEWIPNRFAADGCKSTWTTEHYWSISYEAIIVLSSSYSQFSISSDRAKIDKCCTVAWLLSNAHLQYRWYNNIICTSMHLNINCIRKCYHSQWTIIDERILLHCRKIPGMTMLWSNFLHNDAHIQMYSVYQMREFINARSFCTQ